MKRRPFLEVTLDHCRKTEPTIMQLSLISGAIESVIDVAEFQVTFRR
jgi:hypothetical protein